jgi:cell division protein FtsB
VREVGLVALFLAATLFVAISDTESGLRSWNRLHGDLTAAQARVRQLTDINGALLRQVAALESDPLALESAIREDLELAMPGETVVRFRPANPSIRFP